MAGWSGGPFLMFGTAHLATLLSIIVLIFILIFTFHGANEKKRRMARYTLAALLVLSGLSWQLWGVLAGAWSIKEHLPFHLCSTLTYVSAVMLVKKNDLLYQICFYAGIGGALQAVLTPANIADYGFPHFRYFQFFLNHGLVLYAPIHMTATENFRPTIRGLWSFVIITNIYMVFVGAVNWAVDANYFYLARKPSYNTALDLMGPWPWYILGMEASGIVLCHLFYLPFAVMKHRQNRLKGRERDI